MILHGFKRSFYPGSYLEKRKYVSNYRLLRQRCRRVGCNRCEARADSVASTACFSLRCCFVASPKRGICKRNSSVLRRKRAVLLWRLKSVVVDVGAGNQELLLDVDGAIPMNRRELATPRAQVMIDAKGRLITNFHVFKAHEPLRWCARTETVSGQTWLEWILEPIWRFCRWKAWPIQWLPLGDSDAVKIGHVVMAVGNYMNLPFLQL